MAVTPVSIGRVSQNMQSNLLVSGIQRTMVNLLHQQERLSTGLQIVRPSDDPIGATSTMRMEDLVEAQDQYLSNIDHATKTMNIADTSLSTIQDLLIQAHNLALENVGSTASTEQRHSASILVDSITDQLVTLGNTEYLGSYIFGGRVNNSPPFSVDSNKIVFTGDMRSVTVQVAPEIAKNVSLNAGELFGTGSGIVESYKNLLPGADSNTRLIDIDGAINQGIRTGTFVIEGSVIGQVDVDLNGCATMGDIIEKINDVLPASVNVALSADGRKLELTSTNPGETLQVLESGQGTIAHDLGLYTPSASLSPVVGSDFGSRLTLHTDLGALNGGTGIDLTSGIIITNGENSITLDFSTANTIQDIINAINTSGVGVQAKINADATGINIINQVAGSRLTIGENAGTTAEDLGIRTYRTETQLSDLNEGLGVHPVDGNDFKIITTDGSEISVDASGAVTIGDIIGRINTAATGAGVALTASLATVGNGIVLTDNTAGAGILSVQRENLSNVADELGLLTQAPAGSNQITSTDVNPTREESIFTYLLDLRDALKADDSLGIELAAQGIEAYMDNLNQAHGKLGYMARGLETQKTRTEDAILSTRSLLSNIKDLDYAEAITKFQNIQMTLEANMRTGGQILNTSLLNFLR